MGQRLVLVAVGSIFAFIGAIALTEAAEPIKVAIYSAVLAGGIWIVFRGSLMGLRIDAMGITERGMGRSRTVPWCAIHEVSTGTQGLGPVQTGAPGVVLKGGERMPLTAIASHSRHTTQADLALLKALHAAHLADCPVCASSSSDASG
ncbi:hypothetical protein ACFCV9_37515 [Streptomyces sp. NPDC056367]|uniref:hypothetical protein n=1 Tax=Streptomyces sp. NPDC056367 TaxID=3345797 RepID=UPI0035D82E54